MKNQATQVILNGSFHLPFAPASVMPLLTPEGHRKWVDGWDAAPVYPAAAVDYFPNSVFVTGTGADTAVWTILEAATDHAEYIHTLGASAVGRIRVEVAPAANGSRVSAKFVVTALDARGHEVLKQFSEAAFAEKMRGWETKLTAALSA